MGLLRISLFKAAEKSVIYCISATFYSTNSRWVEMPKEVWAITT